MPKFKAIFKVDPSNVNNLTKEYTAAGRNCDTFNKGKDPQPGWTIHTTECPELAHLRCVKIGSTMIYDLEVASEVICTQAAHETDMIFIEAKDPAVPAKPREDPSSPKADCDFVPT